MKAKTKFAIAIVAGIGLGCIIGFGIPLPAVAHAPQPTARYTYQNVEIGHPSTSMIVVYDRQEGRTCYIATKRYSDGGVGISCP